MGGGGGGAPLFTSEQLRALQMQMHVHFQMLVQTLIIARGAMRKEPAFAQARLEHLFRPVFRFWTHEHFSPTRRSG